jgi:hypothetical protein
VKISGGRGREFVDPLIFRPQGVIDLILTDCGSL